MRAVVAVLLALSCASYSMEYADYLGDNIDGLTGCDAKDRPFVRIRKGLPNGRHAIVQQHEMMHVRQAWREKGTGTV